MNLLVLFSGLLTYFPVSSPTHPTVIPLKAIRVILLKGRSSLFSLPTSPVICHENEVLTLTFKALHEQTTLPSGFIPYFSHPPSWTLLQPHSSVIDIQKHQPPSHLGAFASWTLTLFSPETLVAISHYYWNVSFSMRPSPSSQSKMQFPPLCSLSFPCHSPWHFSQSDMQYGILFLMLNACFLLV